MSEDKPIQDHVDDYDTHEIADQTVYDYNKEESAIKSFPQRRHSRSAFAPIVLISGGVLFLLANLGVIGALDWQAALRFWPLALIFIGLNVLVVQMRPPVGTALSAMVALAAVGVFGYLLLSGPPAALRSLGLAEGRELNDESFWVPLDGVETAEITIDLSNFPAEIGPLTDGGLVGGTIYTYGRMVTEFELENGHARYEVGERSNGGFMFNPDEWFADREEHTWTVGLSPDVPIDLHIDSGNGGGIAELEALSLTDLTVDAGNSRLTVTLPDGDYDARLDAGNGGISVSLPRAGAHEVRLDGGNGSIELTLPAGIEARVEYDTGNGSINVPPHLRRVSGNNDEGVYETDGYDRAAVGLLLIVDSGNGTVNITTP